MKIYWYWPHRHASSSALCRATLLPGDALTVHALKPAAEESLPPIEEYEVVRDLPDPANVPSTRLGRMTRRPQIAWQRSRARARVLRRGFDVAHIGNLFYQTDWVDLWRLRRRVRLVCDVHDVRPHRTTMPAALETAVLRSSYKAAHQLIVLHDVLKDEIVADFGIEPARVHVVPHVLPVVPTVDPSKRSHQRPVFLLFGTLRANKGLEVLADAVTRLGPALDADVVVAGSGDATVAAMLRQRLSALPNVTLELGPITPARKHELFARASWAVLPYTSFHSQSGVLADAYAYRVPLIVTDVGAIGPTVSDDRTGFVIAPADVDELADALLRAAEAASNAFADALSSAAHRYDVSVVGPRLRAIWDLAVADR